MFRLRAQKAGLSLRVESAGTGAWHQGEPPDERARATGEARGYSFVGQTARKVITRDFIDFDYILAMDSANYQDLLSMADPAHHHKIHLFLDFAASISVCEVPDPYYGGPQGFEYVLDLIEAASDGLIDHICTNP